MNAYSKYLETLTISLCTRREAGKMLKSLASQRHTQAHANLYPQVTQKQKLKAPTEMVDAFNERTCWLLSQWHASAQDLIDDAVFLGKVSGQNLVALDVLTNQRGIAAGVTSKDAFHLVTHALDFSSLNFDV